MKTVHSTIHVRQRQYAIGTKGTQTAVLATENIWTCLGFVGVHNESSTVFLCHLNTPLCAFSIPKLFSELQEKTSDLQGFKLYEVYGVNPAYVWFMHVFSVWMAFLGHLPLGIAAGFMGLFYHGTRLHLAFRLRTLKVGLSKPIVLGHSCYWLGFGRSGVRIDADTSAEPIAYSYVKPRTKALYTPPHAMNFTMTKAHGSD